MIIVTGTKRSGTSMWMQILKAAGYPVLGEAFPRDWGETLREANREGFYESSLRFGVYHATNPHPRTGAFLAPSETRRMAVKVFTSGLIKTDLAYVDRVVATMRDWREYKSSLQRLYAMELANKRARAERLGHGADKVPELAHANPALEWWADNYQLLRDALIRRYPLHMTSYASVLRDPQAVLSETFTWLGSGNVDAAVQAVQSSLRTQAADSSTNTEPSGLSREHEQLFDELYAHVDERRPLSAAFIDRLNDTDEQLSPQIAAMQRAVRENRKHAARQVRIQAVQPPNTEGTVRRLLA